MADDDDEPLTDLDVQVDASAVASAAPHAAEEEQPTRQVSPEVLQRELEKSRAAGGGGPPDAAKVHEIVSASLEVARRDLPTAPSDFTPAGRPPDPPLPVAPAPAAAPPPSTRAAIALDVERGPRGTVKMARPGSDGALSPAAKEPPRRSRSVLVLLVLLAVAIGAGVTAFMMAPGK